MALGALDIIIAADTAQLRKGMDEAVGIMKSSTKTMESVAKTAGTAIAGYFAFDALKGSIQHTLDFADSLGKMSQKIGVSVDALYAMQAAGKLADVNLETLEKSLLKFNKGLGTAQMGSGDTANALKNLGISLKDSSGHMKMSDQYLNEVADKFKAMPDGIGKSTLAMQLFGKSGAEMIPLLNGGSEALTEFSGVMDEKTAKSAERFNDSMTRIGLSVGASSTTILTGMLPVIESLSGTFEDMAEWVLKNQSSIDDFTAQAGNDLTALGMVGHDVFALIADTSGDMLKIVAEVFNEIPGLMGISSDDAIDNFGFFEYFILGLSTATNGLGQFIANAKMAYATVTEYREKYLALNPITAAGKLVGIGVDQTVLAQAKMDYHSASLDAIKYTQNVVDTYNALTKAKEKYKSGGLGKTTPLSSFDLEDFGRTESNSKKIEAQDKKAHDDRVKAMADINKATANQQKYDEYQLKLIEDRIKLEAEADEQAKQAIKTYTEGLTTAQIEYYTSIGDASSAYYLEEEAKMQRLAETGYYTNEQMNAIKSKDNETFRKEQWARDNELTVNMISDFNKAMDNQLFDAMTGKWESWGDWFKDFWSSISTSVMRSISSQLANSLTQSLTDSLTGTSSSGGIQNIFSQFGLFGGSAQGVQAVSVGVGTTLSDSQLQAIGGTSGQEFRTDSGTVINSSGQIVSAGTDIADIAKSIPTSTYASYIKDAYGTVSGWFGAGSGLSASELAAGEMANAGTGAASSSSSLLGAAGTWLGWTAFFKTLSGFLWSDSGLNKLFGTQYGTIAHDTMKYGAGSYNWSTGQLNSGYGWMGDTKQWGQNLSWMTNPNSFLSGDIRDQAYFLKAMSNPIAGITGHLDPIQAGIMGGLFGSGQTTTTPLLAFAKYILGTSSATGSSGYQVMPMLSSTDGGLLGGGGDEWWFQNSNFSSQTIEGIKSYIGMFDELLAQLGKTDKMIVAGGMFTSIQEFLDTNVLYSFFDKLTTADSVTVTNAWKTYASSISKSVMDAFSEVLGSKISYERGFTEWSLGSGTTEQLKFTSDYLNSDLASYQKSLGVSGVTKDNFLSKYNQAMEALYTPETSKSWQTLGDALMRATDAQKAYSDALKASTANIQKPTDMLLSKVTDSTARTGSNDGTVTKELLNVFNKLIRVLDQQNMFNQLAAGRA